MSYMFYNCSKLSKINTEFIINEFNCRDHADPYGTGAGKSGGTGPVFERGVGRADHDAAPVRTSV